MRILFEMDKKDYVPNGSVFSRSSARAINYIFRKPNKRIFDLALEKAQLQPDEVWYIGDQYECDVNGALNAGLLPVWYIGAIDLPYTMEEIHSMEERHFIDRNILTVKSWSELEQYMEV